MIGLAQSLKIMKIHIKFLAIVVLHDLASTSFFSPLPLLSAFHLHRPSLHPPACPVFSTSVSSFLCLHLLFREAVWQSYNSMSCGSRFPPPATFQLCDRGQVIQRLCASVSSFLSGGMIIAFTSQRCWGLKLILILILKINVKGLEQLLVCNKTY